MDIEINEPIQSFKKKGSLITNVKVKGGIFSVITGWLSILADIAGLVGFVTGFLKPNYSNFFLHPALWLVIQFTITIYGNTALAYSYMMSINKIYQNKKSYVSNDVKNSMYLFTFFLWIPSFLVWIVSYFVFATADIVFLSVIVVLFAFFAFPFGGFLIASWGALLARTLKPDLPIKLKLSPNGP